MLERSGELRVYTFTLPKFVSGFVRKCMNLFQKDDPQTDKKRKKEKR
jgi:hypothetical protein